MRSKEGCVGRVLLHGLSLLDLSSGWPTPCPCSLGGRKTSTIAEGLQAWQRWSHAAGSHRLPRDLPGRAGEGRRRSSRCDQHQREGAGRAMLPSCCCRVPPAPATSQRPGRCDQAKARRERRSRGAFHLSRRQEGRRPDSRGPAGRPPRTATYAPSLAQYGCITWMAGRTGRAGRQLRSTACLGCHTPRLHQQPLVLVIGW